MKPSDALKAVFAAPKDYRIQPDNKSANQDKIDKALEDFDEAISSILLSTIKHSDNSDSDHHAKLTRPWLNDPEYKAKLHEYDYIFDKPNKGEGE
jgi:hypothetical protein